jgi:Ca2+-binding EF-hand superfamily protein
MTNISGISGSSSMIQQMMQQMFQKADTDGNASLSLEEFKAGAPKGPNGAQAPQGMPDISQIFTKIDANGDGTLSKDEFSTGFQKMHDEAKTALLQAQEQSSSSFMDELLKKADTNGDGSLSKDEFAAAAPKGPPPGPPPSGGTSSSQSSDASKVFDSLDTNQDGQVSMDELLAGAQKKHEQEGSTTGQAQQSDQQATALLNLLKDAAKLYEDLGKNYAQQAQTQTQSVIA